MKRLLLIILSMGLFYISGAQVLSPVMTGNVTGQKVLSDRNVSFNVGSPIPYLYKGGTTTKLQVGFPYNALYMDRTFPGELFVSKGYFPDQIQLRWEILNNSSIINHFEIFRKKLNEKDSVWVDNVVASGRKWEDFYAEANEIYQYTVIAKGIPGGQRSGYTNVEGIGFRTPLATITGRVSFSGGNGVKDVVITASTDDKVPSKSLSLSGSSFIEIPQRTNADFSGGFTFQAYLKFSSTADAGIFGKGSNFELNYTSQKFVFKVGTQIVELPYTVPTDKFIHVSAVYDGSTAKLYIPIKALNGQGQSIDTLLSVSAAITNSITANGNSIFLGKVNTSYFNGNIDEVRIWKRALPKDEILRDFNRYLLGKEDGIYAYLRMNEGFGQRIYDIAKNGSYFNENHGDFKGGSVSWSSVFPTIDQLGNRGITDKEGNYIIPGVPFLTDGSAYKFTPMLAPHEFDPGYKILFLSENAVVHNNINFIDISSFNVNGSVVYRNTTKGVKGVQILLDGQPIYGPDTREEVTNEKGLFEVQVPIGAHFISLRKDGHSFDLGGRWPYDAAHPDSIIRHDFNQNLTFGKAFSDTTLITVVGRVIGGTSSNNIAFGFGESVNNIGKATITLDHSSSNPELTFDNVGAGLGTSKVAYTIVNKIDPPNIRKTKDIEHFVNRTQIETQIFTSAASGEFVAKLIPEKFVIVNIDVDDDAANDVKNFFGNRVIDLSVNPKLKKEYLVDKDNKKIDSLEYHVKLNYIYQTPPEIKVTNKDDTKVFYGEKEINFTNPVDGVKTVINVEDHFKYPVFEMMKNYSPKISVFESYHNFDSGKDTYQSVKEAEIKIINDLAISENQKVYQLKPEMNGEILHSFKVGVPNIAKSENDGTSFTKTMQINVTVDGNTFSWKPGGEFYRAYIIGQRPKGNNFYTKGPQIPEIILHDPPGSKSSAYIERGSSYSVSSKFSTNFDNGSGFGAEILLGVEVGAGGGLAGPVIKTDTKNSGKTGLNFSTSINEEGEYVQTYEFSERIETSSDPGVVGSMGDIYIGKSYNYFYGETDFLKIVPYNLATTNGIVALGTSELKKNDFTIGIVDGFIMNPDNSDTYFKYTQAHILNKLLPEIESRRNGLFLTSFRTDGKLKYKSEIAASDLRYGIAHSYKVVATPADTTVYGYYKMTPTDSILTYSFKPEKITVEDINKIRNGTIYENDSIRYYNTQIGIWIDAIRLNESEKAMAIKKNVLEQNISFDGAVGAISRKEVQTISYSKEESRTKNMHFGAQGSVGFTFNSTGVIATGEISISHSLGVSSGESSSQTMEYGYTLADGNVGDYYSINVFRRVQNGVYKATDLAETKMSMPIGYDFGSLGAGVALVGGGIAVAASASYSAGGGIPIVAGAAVMAVAAGLSYIPYVSFLDKVKDAGALFKPGDIRVSSFDISSPIFSTLGGQTMCPYEGLEQTFFYKDNNKSVVLHKATLQREKPEITAEPREIFNVPSTEAALFNVKLTNNTESGDDQWYALIVDERTNQKGALVLIDGEFSQKLIYVPANTTVTKLVTVQPSNPSVMDFENIGIILHSVCQFDPTDFIAEISDTVSISAHFQPACTNAEILEPLNNFVVNVRDKDTLTVRIGKYNLGHQSFQSLRFEYKASSGNIWVPVKYFVNNPLLANKDEIPDTLLINDQPFVTFDWDMTNMKDRAYDIRVVSTCTDYSENESVILSGILDGQRPQVFGTPQPADGILNVDENISIRFNEPIEGSLLTQFNFDVKGTLNYYLLKHEAYLRFNGTSDYASIPAGINFSNKSFTAELWVKPDNYGSSVLLSQGNDPATNLEIGLTTGFKTYFKIGNVKYEVPFQFSLTVPAEAWQHLAYVFDYETGDIFIYQNDKIILEVRGANVVFNNSGKVYIGKSSVNEGGYFKGSMHELRIWSKYLSLGDVYARQYTALSGNEVSLYGYWPLDEAFGKLAIDKAANRHIEVNAPWGAFPGGSSWNFTGKNFLEFNTGYFAIIPEMDYTLEFWFKDNNPADTVTLFSNQKGDGKEGKNLMDKTLSVYATPDGKIWVSSQGKKIEVVTTDYFDNSWHHFAMVVRRRGNLTSFIDGQPQHEKENTIVGGIAGGKMYLGVRKWNNVNGTGQDRFYTGKLDEFRLWDLAKTTTQIRMDMNSKLKGDETGLLVYLPLEGYFEDALGVVQQQTSLKNFVADTNAKNAVPSGGNAFSTDAPNMKDVRPVQSIAYDYVASEDEIILDPKSYLFPQLEKNIIEITVQGVEDKYGNRMASPVTWTAYVSRNQVRWEDERRSFIKELYKTMTFESTIKNTGGQQIGFEITGLPPWLSASPSTGVINPESTRVITFTINPAINIGEYNADIILRTANGFDEKLPVSVKVFKTPPSWKVNPSAFEHTMNMVGRIKIEGVLSTDVFDMVAAFKEGTDSIRGVANIRYLEDLDSYMVFMNVYGNTNGEKLTFRVWDASAGQILDRVLPDDVVFVPNGVNGTTKNPVIFTAINLYRSYIPLAAGWNWLSFNKLSPDQNNLNTFMASIESKPNDQIKTHGGGFNNYDPLLGWSFGGIESINNNLMYQIKVSKADTLIYNGTYIEPEAHQMTLASGWNHVAYIPDLLMDVNEALRLYSASEEEIIKSQYAFAMFDQRVGWIGTLEFMKPGFGYMIKTRKTATLKYPNTSLLKDAKIEKQSTPPSGWSANLVKYEGNMSVIARLETSKFPEVLINDQMVLGAFINKECHGYTVPITNAGIDYSPFFLNVSNDKTEQQVQFRLYDGLSGNTYLIEETKVYAENAVYGSTLSPQILTLKGQYTGVNGELIANATLNCYPNPFNEGLTIDYNFAGGLMKLEIMDLTGRVINKLFDGISDPGLKSIVWDGKSGNGTAVSAGMYYVRLSAGKSVETVKITKNR
ncbi:MAG: LamG-like jellyroll fold domain-containing protein [Bacteroidota bacterium]|nr:LamG-like jellyroll fold domain-containing protein [Bacteroidota bacterium]